MGLALMLCVSFRTRVSIVVVSVTLPPLVRIAGMATLEIYEYINDTIDNILSFFVNNSEYTYDMVNLISTILCSNLFSPCSQLGLSPKAVTI